ncbi:hypothetical protein [Mesoterricola sediminis]|uniref:Uncharacterized protein n=1 Tax=Mesoterricola sediminis TaxID=2927980 RepID=A0AA48KDG4_9BACT|nr:hypothetical protein [Mesoterricola sediminis]BDU76297.1 hypothetical protein METESE_12550 [Mesoterricola sediminis]
MAVNVEISSTALTAVTTARGNYTLTAGDHRKQYGTLSVNEFVGTCVLLMLERLAQDHTYETEFRKRAAAYKASSQLVA